MLRKFIICSYLGKPVASQPPAVPCTKSWQLSTEIGVLPHFWCICIRLCTALQVQLTPRVEMQAESGGHLTTESPNVRENRDWFTNSAPRPSSQHQHPRPADFRGRGTHHPVPPTRPRRLQREEGCPVSSRAALRDPGAFATTRPGARKALGPAGKYRKAFPAKPRSAGLPQAAAWPSSSWPTAGLKQPSLRRMGHEALGRRNAAPVQAHHS
jgi:hypothetical protein